MAHNVCRNGLQMSILVPSCPFEDPEVIIDYFDVDESGLLTDCLVLIGFFFALRFIAFLALKIKVSLEFLKVLFKSIV